jgi:hypothetical protein
LAQGKVIHYFCQDETRVGLKTQSGKVITAKGVKPKVTVQWGRENFWQLLKQPLKNQLFPSLEALRERVQERFAQLTVEQVMSVSSYNFILEALFYATSH